MSRRKDQDLSAALKELARKHPRYGYRRLHQMLLRSGVGGAKVNVKRVRRLCVKLNLKLPARRKRKRRGIGVSVPVVAEYPNHVVAYDFVHDWCENGRQLKILTVEDEFTRECLKLEVDHRMGAMGVCRTLEKVMQERGAPAFVRSDNGPEFIAKALMRMLAAKGIKCQHIEPGSPWQNGKNERFNGTLRSECTQDGDVPSSGPCAGGVRAVQAALQPGAAALEFGVSNPGGVRAAARPAGCRQR